MMQVLHPTYTLTITVTDRMRSPQVFQQVYAAGSLVGMVAEVRSPHKFYNEPQGKTGCDEVIKAVTEALRSFGPDVEVEVSLERFERKP